MKSWAFAIFVALSMSSCVTPSLPYLMFSAIVVAKRTGSWLTTPICSRNHFKFRERTSWPSTETLKDRRVNTSSKQSLGSDSHQDLNLIRWVRCLFRETFHLKIRLIKKKKRMGPFLDEIWFCLLYTLSVSSLNLPHHYLRHRTSVKA